MKLSSVSLFFAFVLMNSISVTFAQPATNKIDSTGNVGIGTISPTEKLEIASGNILMDYNYRLIWNNANNFFGADSPGNEALKMAYSGSINVLIDSDNNGTSSSFSIKNNNTSAPLANTLMIVEESGKVGVGISSPQARFNIYNDGIFDTQQGFTNQDHILLSAPNPGNGNYFGGLTWKSGSRRRASIVAVMEHSDSDYVGLAFLTQGVDGPGSIYESMRISRNGNVGIGTTNPDKKLTVKGKIHSEEVIVDLNVPGPDYVFEEDYDLATLKDLEAYIKANKHLPEIPSAKEMEANGITLGEMNMLLLKKIEELTLYSIAQEKMIQKERKMQEKLTAKLKNQEKAILELFKRIEMIENTK